MSDKLFGDEAQVGTVKCPESECKVPAGSPCVYIDTWNGLTHSIKARAFIHRSRRELREKTK